MRFNARPTRAEVSDVANAVLDGADGVMLSGETAVGRYPIETVQMMDRIICETEASARFQQRPEPPSVYRRETTNAMARAAVVAARELEAKNILCFSESGYTARLLSDYRPKSGIVVATRTEAVYHRLALEWGVTPLLLEDVPSKVEPLIHAIAARAIETGDAVKGETAVFIVGSRQEGPRDLILVREL